MNEKTDNFDALWDFADPASSEARFREALARVPESAIGLRLDIETQIARAQGLAGRFADALATLAGIEARVPEEMPEARVRCLLERGRVLNSSGDASSAVSLFEEAWDLARDVGADALAVDAAHMLGIALPPDEQIEWNTRALEFAESSRDEKARRWLGPLYNNLGWSHHDRGEYERALEIFEKALSWRASQARGREGEREHGREVSRAEQIARWSVARAKRSLGRHDEALEMQRALLEELEREGIVDGYVHEELAECLLALGGAEKARPHFARAHALLSRDSWLVANETARLERMAELGGVSTTLYGLIFDVDGVIADTEAVNARASIKVFADLFGLEGVAPEDFEAGLGRGAVEYVRAAARVHGLELSDDDVERATVARQENFLALLRESPLPAFPGVLELMRSAMGRDNFRVAIATSSAREKSQAVLDSAGVPYDEIVYVTGSDVRHKKPHPELFLMAADRIGVAPARCVVIEDAPNGVESARMAGAKCVAVTNSVSSEKLAAAERIVASVSDIAVDDLVALVNA